MSYEIFTNYLGARLQLLYPAAPLVKAVDERVNEWNISRVKLLGHRRRSLYRPRLSWTTIDSICTLINVRPEDLYEDWEEGFQEWVA